MAGFYMKCKTKLKWVNKFLEFFVSNIFNYIDGLFRFLHTDSRSAFRTQSGIKDGGFCENTKSTENAENIFAERR